MRRRLTISARATAAAIALILAAGAAQANAQSPTPGSGYTFDQHWNCGVFSVVQQCWYPGVLGDPGSGDHTWGWASADYDGGGTVHVHVMGANCAGAPFCVVFLDAQGNNLARGCEMSTFNCNDQSTDLFGLEVDFSTGSNHTILGHGLA